MYQRIDIPGARWIDVVNNLVVYDTVTPNVGIHMALVHEDTPGHFILVPFWFQPTPEPMMFVRAAQSADGVIWAAAKGNNSGSAYLVSQNVVLNIGITNGNNPIAVRGVPLPLAPNDVVTRWTMPNGQLATRVNGLVGVGSIPYPWTGTASGILELAPDGAVRFMDEYRIKVIAGRTFWKPNEDKLVIVGQTDPPAIRCAIGDYIFTALDGLADDPHVSVMGTRIFVTAFTPNGASVAVIDTPYPPQS